MRWHQKRGLLPWGRPEAGMPEEVDAAERHQEPVREKQALREESSCQKCRLESWRLSDESKTEHGEEGRRPCGGGGGGGPPRVVE